MLKDFIIKIIQKSINKSFDINEIIFSVETPPRGLNYDYASNIVLLLSKKINIKPTEIFKKITSTIKSDVFDKVDLINNFINFKLSDSFIINSFVESKIKKSPVKKILIEFVSANPTGPLHIGHGRGAAIGDSLQRIFKFLGNKVKSEYYVNDVGRQINLLTASVLSSKSENHQNFIRNFNPQELYKGKYINELSKKIEPKNKSIDEIKKIIIRNIIDNIKKDLNIFGITFDEWVYESKFYENKYLQNLIEDLKNKKLLYQKDGATYLNTKDYGCEKDEVIIRSDLSPTYFAGDIAYHKYKFERGFDLYINVWGQDHKTHAERIYAVLRAIKLDEKKLKIVLYPLVSLIKKNQRITMSTREGKFVTLEEVINEVGVDACRFFLVMRKSTSHLEFDLDLAKKQSKENPVYYVQYVHARCNSIIEESKKRYGIIDDKFTYQKLNPDERSLLLHLLLFYDVIKISADDLSSHHLINYLIEVASKFHKFYESCRVLVEDKMIRNFRLKIVQTTKKIIKDGLELVGVSAPERM